MEKRIVHRIAADELPRLTLRDMMAPLFRHWIAVAVTFATIFLLSIVVAFGWANHYYVASMQVVVGRERVDATVTPQPTTALQETSRVVTTDDVSSEIALLQGPDMLMEVVKTCNLEEGGVSLMAKGDLHNLDIGKATALENASKSLAGMLKVEAQKNSHVIDVHYGTTKSPETAACVLQALGKLYLAKHLKLQRPAGALDFFSQETDKYQKALTESENELVKFSKAAGVAAPDILRTNLAQELVAAHSTLYNTRQAIAADKQRLENIKAQMAVTPARSSTSEASLSANLLLDHLHSSLLAAELKRTQLLTKYDPSFPLVKEVDQEIAQTKEALAKAEDAKYVNKTTDRDQTFEYLRQDQAKTEADLASEQAKEMELTNTIRDIQVQMVNFDVKAVQQSALLREAKANEGNYLLYLTKREQERASDALDDKRVSNVAISVPATVPILPAHSAFSILFGGFWLGLLGGVGAGYVAELADPSFRTPGEVEKLLDITVLAALPKQVS